MTLAVILAILVCMIWLFGKAWGTKGLLGGDSVMGVKKRQEGKEYKRGKFYWR